VKRSLITGGHGFIASHLATALLARGDSVSVLDRGSPPVSGLALLGVEAEVEMIGADLCDAEVVDAVVSAGEFDAVFHLAAQTIVGSAMADPAATFETNVRGTWTLLEACRRADVPAVVVASSDKAYGPQVELPYREGQELRPASPYEASKAAADVIALSYWRGFGLPVAVTRFANVYGGGDLNLSRLIPEAVCAVLDDRRPVIRSDGSPERDFLFVDDAVAAYLAIEHAVGAGGPAAGEPLNAGGGEPHAVLEVLRLLGEVVGGEIEPEIRGLGNPEGEIDRQYVDAAKLRQMTGWSPQVGLRDGLARTVAWYREHPALLAVLAPPAGRSA
jgi:CDP-glucose 4,6-dehydratase